MSTFPRTLRIASYNIFKAQFFEARSDAAEARAVLEDVTRLDAAHPSDVLALQEAIVGPLVARGPARDTVAEIGARLGLDPRSSEASRHLFFAGSRDRTGREWGCGLVSRPPAQFHAVSLPKAAWSPWRRGAIVAEIGSWLVATLHLEVWPLVGTRSRQQQTQTLLEALERIDAGRGAPAVLAGDFNCELGSGPHRELVKRGFRPALPQRCTTFLSHGLRLHLDHIYVRGARILDAGVEQAARGSDHRPIWAILERD